MAGGFDLNVSTDGFTGFCDAVAKGLGKPMEPVLRNQVGAVLEICVKRSPGKNNSLIRQKTRLRVEKPARYVRDGATLVDPIRKRVPRPLPVSSQPLLQTLTGTRGGTKGRQYLIFKKDGKTLFLPVQSSKGKTDSWTARQAASLRATANAIAGQLKPKADAAVEAIGSIKKSWVQSADLLGIPLRLSDSSFVRKARTPYNDGTGSRVIQESGKVLFEVVNHNSMLIERYHGADILAGAIQTRLRAFQHEMRAGVFDNVAALARRYPGIAFS
ncbi:MAG: hypothetical protein V4710_06045 [Verrucomicrobiota bacterium]